MNIIMGLQEINFFNQAPSIIECDQFYNVSQKSGKDEASLMQAEMTTNSRKDEDSLVQDEMTNCDITSPVITQVHNVSGFMENIQQNNCSTPQPSGCSKPVSNLVKNIKAELPNVQVFVTSPSSIPESQMSQSVHILTRSNPEQRRTDVIRDGFTYKRTPTNKKFPPFLGSNQQVAVYNCVGRLVCLNPDCDVFKRWTYCNSVPNQKDTPARCRFCSTGSEDGQKLVENGCSGKKWVITSPDSQQVISYYDQEHSCGKADFVVSEEVLNQEACVF